MQAKYIKSFDKKDIYCYLWDNVKEPIGVVQIMHGMQEHAARYDDFAQFLNKNGYIVFADDHRAHGQTAESIDKLGKYDGGNLFYDTLRDELYFSSMLKKEYPNLPLYVFGHSYGSFILQNYIQTCSKYDKAILCGSACMKGKLSVKLGRAIAKTTMKHKGGDKVAALVERIMLKSYNSQVKTGSWINSDPAECEKYYNDPYCGVPFSSRFYYDFFTGLKNLYDKHKLREIDHKKPIMLISGKNDPVGDMGKSVVKLFKLYHEEDVNVTMKLYDNARHEILNEPAIKEIVYNDILNFFKTPCSHDNCTCKKCARLKQQQVARKPKAKKAVTTATPKTTKK